MRVRRGAFRVRADAQEVLIDGASLTIPESGGTVFNMPSAEMFNEFKLLTGGYSSEYGRFGGGVEIYVTKSGTNTLHGAGFLNMARDIWQANAWANNARGAKRPKRRENEAGGSIGGPVFIPKVYDGRNKTFWFFTYTKQLQPATISNASPVPTLPTVLMKQGNFTELGTQLIYDPSTTSGSTRTPFAGNVIPSARFSTVAKNLLPLIPNPTRGTLTNNYDFINTSAITRDIWSIKGDHAITDNNRVSFFLSKEKQDTANVTNLPGPIGQGLGANPNKPYNLRLNNDWVLRPTFIMHTTFGKSATRQGWDNPAQVGYASKLGIPGVPAEADAMPRIVFEGQAGLTPYGVQDGKVAKGGQDNDTLMITQGYSWLKGKHEFKFGWDARWLSTIGRDYAGGNGRYYFNRLQTALPNTTSGSGHEFASLLLGGVNQADKTVLPVLFNYVRYRYYSGYFQDNWRLSRRLTLNLGMRYEVPIGWHIDEGNYSAVNINTPNPAAGGRPGALVFAGFGPGRQGEKRFWGTDFTNIGPRLGFAYQIAANTVLRGGWGIFYQTLGNGGCGCRQGFATTASVFGNGLDPVLNWDNGIPTPASFKPPPQLDPSLANFQDVDVMGPTFGQAPRIQNWSFNIQHTVKNWLIDVGYLGNRGTKLASSLNMNQLPVSELSRGALLRLPISDPAAQSANIKAPFEGFGNRTVAQALRPFPQYLNVISRNAGVGKTWYDAFQAKVEKRFGGLQMLATYTWSKSLSVGHFRQIFTQTQSYPQDAYNVSDSKSFLPFDQPHVFNFLWTYELPLGKGKRWGGDVNAFTNALLGGWNISGAHRYYSGNLIEINTPGNPLGSLIFAGRTKGVRTGTAIRTDLDRDKLDPGNKDARWFNYGANAPFAAAAPFTLGTSAFFVDEFRQPSIAVENISLMKRTTLWENERNPIVLVYRADAFNMLNRTRFGVNGSIGNADFGRATGPQVGARAITMGLRLEF